METVTKTELEQLNDHVAARALELGKIHNCIVHPLLFGVTEGSDERVIGYIKEPNRTTKIRILDKSTTQGPLIAASELLEAGLIKEESDSRIYDENPLNDKFYIGAVVAASNIIEFTRQQFKKK